MLADSPGAIIESALLTIFLARGAVAVRVHTQPDFGQAEIVGAWIAVVAVGKVPCAQPILAMVARRAGVAVITRLAEVGRHVEALALPGIPLAPRFHARVVLGSIAVDDRFRISHAFPFHANKLTVAQVVVLLRVTVSVRFALTFKIHVHAVATAVTVVSAAAIVLVVAGPALGSAGPRKLVFLRHTTQADIVRMALDAALVARAINETTQLRYLFVSADTSEALVESAFETVGGARLAILLVGN